MASARETVCFNRVQRARAKVRNAVSFSRNRPTPASRLLTNDASPPGCTGRGRDRSSLHNDASRSGCTGRVRGQSSFRNDASPPGCTGRGRGKDAGSGRSGATDGTEDAASGRPVRPRPPRLRCETSSPDAGSGRSGATYVTEDAASRRPVLPGGRCFVFQQPPIPAFGNRAVAMDERSVLNAHAAVRSGG